jgi:hypothetical protein
MGAIAALYGFHAIGKRYVEILNEWPDLFSLTRVNKDRFE